MEAEETSPTRAYSHDPFVYDELKEWLDGLCADIERLGDDGKFDPDLSVVTSWVRRVCRGGKAGFKDVAEALIKEG